VDEHVELRLRVHFIGARDGDVQLGETLLVVILGLSTATGSSKPYSCVNDVDQARRMGAAPLQQRADGVDRAVVRIQFA
jgi:hypothetical protein